MLSRPGTAHGPSGNWELDHEPLSDLEVVRQHHRQHPQAPLSSSHRARAVGLQGTGDKGDRHGPPCRAEGRPSRGQHWREPRQRGGGVGQLSDTRPLSRSFGTTSGCGTSRVAHHERRLPSRLRKCWGSAAGRGRGGICQNCECTCVPRQDESSSRFRRTDDTRQVTLAQRCPRGNGADKPVATGRGEKWWHPHLAGVPRPHSHPCFSPGVPKTPERHWEMSKPKATWPSTRQHRPG